METSVERPTCDAHGLVIASDGQCVLCRREPPQRPSATPVSLLVAFCGLFVIGLAGYAVIQSQARSKPVAAAAPGSLAEAMRRVPIKLYETHW